jgi:hypothetical protein
VLGATTPIRTAIAASVWWCHCLLSDGIWQMGYGRAVFGVSPVEAVVKKITALRTSAGL